MQSQKQQNDLCPFPRQIIQYHSNPSLRPKPLMLKKLKLNGSMKTYKTCMRMKLIPMESRVVTQRLPYPDETNWDLRSSSVLWQFCTWTSQLYWANKFSFFVCKPIWVRFQPLFETKKFLRDIQENQYCIWPPHAKSWLIGKDSYAGRDWGQEEKGTT